MRGLAFSLSCLSVVLVHSAALALPQGTTFSAFIDEGPVLEPVGSLEFTLSETQIGMLSGGWTVMCRYLLEWRADEGAPFETFCSVDEVAWIGHRNCVENAQSSFGSLILRVPNSPCAGFGLDDVPHNIFQLVAGEGSGIVEGTIQFTAASARVSGFRALAGP